jgi:hypothetical protein
MTMAFPALLISVGIVRREAGTRVLSACMILLLVINLFVPQSYVTSNNIFPMR